jgi:hypothetical protein
MVTFRAEGVRASTMQSEQKIHVLQSDESVPRRISRRELAQTLLAAVAVGACTPLFSPAHPIHKHLLHAALLDSVDAVLSNANHKPLFLSPQQLATLDVLAEAIVPGSRQARAAEFIDLLLSVDTSDARQNFVASLQAFASASRSGYRTEIPVLSSSRLHGLLATASTGGTPLQEPFDHLKAWIAGAYYSSEIGMRELGWRPDRVFSTFPGCTHPDGHA